MEQTTPQAFVGREALLDEVKRHNTALVERIVRFQEAMLASKAPLGKLHTILVKRGENMEIYVDVKLCGARNEIIESALVDTGAEISLMPRSIAAHIGAWCTNQLTNVEGIHGEVRTLPIVSAYIYFPLLNYIGGHSSLTAKIGKR